MDQTSDPHSLQNPITKTYVGSRTLGARGGGVRDAVVGRVLAMGLRAEVAEQGVVGRCRPGWGGGTEHGSAVTVGEMLEHIKR